MSRLLLVLSLLAGCSTGGEDVCAGQDPFHAGTFSSPRGEWTGSGRYFSHADTGAKTIVIEHLDDDTARLRITYQRAGKTVVEIWKGSTGTGDATRLGWSDKPPVRYGFEVPSSAGQIGVEVGGVAGLGVTLRNTGNQPLAPTFALAGDPAFTLESPNCPEVKGGSTCSIPVIFRPRSADLVTAQLTVTAPPAPGTMTAIVTGRGFYRDAGAEAGVDGAPPDAGPD